MVHTDLLLLLVAKLPCVKGKPERPQCKEPSREFSVHYVTIYLANVFPSPNLRINLFFPHKAKNHLKQGWKLFRDSEDFFFLQILAFPSPFSNVILPRTQKNRVMEIETQLLRRGSILGYTPSMTKSQTKIRLFVDFARGNCLNLRTHLLAYHPTEAAEMEALQTSGATLSEQPSSTLGLSSEYR